MLVSHGHQFIYTKTLKTASTSVEAYFEPFCVEEGAANLARVREESVSAAGIVGYRGPGKPEGCRWWNHMPAAQIREQLGEDLWTRYFKFCVIRNPYEKAISAFYFGRSHAPSAPDSPSSDAAAFEHWLMTHGPPIDRNKYLIDGQFCLDEVIRYESLAADLERICAKLGVPWNPEALPQLKTGTRPKVAIARALYTNKSRQLVETAYAFELDYFGYQFPDA
ncbi:sulfotransferase family 2 domain-containing protein [Thermoleptolyngbya sichuanensis XZ-Cy5]|uniref:sulfotransferase family 2 domain-containing protein n=1 Tax=Thermoleptolyngbya sichuanensis TaxID=2885951 RepID=UPI00240D8B42|nr:sulfotransferase family 2 domain-containing protein [Thermoleptolyngbya sichuanensis]MDG2617288.1 sulfotransferase family 2 domain-containing protein [Thermoleptolyngbya sichuanensis XZ-Cy5]